MVNQDIVFREESLEKSSYTPKQLTDENLNLFVFITTAGINSFPRL